MTHGILRHFVSFCAHLTCRQAEADFLHFCLPCARGQASQAGTSLSPSHFVMRRCDDLLCFLCMFLTGMNFAAWYFTCLCFYALHFAAFLEKGWHFATAACWGAPGNISPSPSLPPFPLGMRPVLYSPSILLLNTVSVSSAASW